MAEISSLEIKVTAEGAKEAAKDIKSVSRALQNLSKKIPDISSSLSKVNYDGFSKLEESLKGISKIDLSGLKSVSGIFQTMERLNALKISKNLNDINSVLNGGEVTVEPPSGESNASSFQSKIKQIEKSFNSMKKVISNATKSLTNFFKSVGRIAMYRLIRSGIKMVTEAFSEGINNVYQWSKVVNGTFAKSMDLIKTSTTYLKNSIGASLVSLLNNLAPVIDSIVEKIVDGVNAINKAIATLTGSATWVKATKQATEYASAVDDAKNATKSLAGFDELNNIGSSSSSSSSGTDYSGMFEEVDNDGVSKLADIIGVIKEHIAEIAALLVGLKSVDLLKGMGLSFSQLAGLGLIISGITLAIEGVIAAFNDPSWKNIGNIITGIGLVVTGLGVAFLGVPAIIAGVIVTIVGLFTRYHDQVVEIVEKINNTIDNALNWVHENITTNFGVFGTLIGSFLESAITLFKDGFNNLFNTIDGLATGIKQIITGIISIFKGDFKTGISQVLQGLLTLVKTILNSVKNTCSIAFNAIKTLISTLFTNIVSTVSSKVKSIINNYVISPLNKMINWINNALQFSYSGLTIAGKQIIPSFTVQLAHLNNIASLDVGTGYVPEDQLAMVHQGEAVIPKKFNSEEYFGNNNETNDLLRELINVVLDKDMNTYLDGNEIGKASVNYINKQSRLKGSSIV